MKQRIAMPLLLLAALAGGCADMGSLGGTKYGETDGTAASQSDRNGTIAQLENIQVDDRYKLGVGTAVGAVAGGLLGSGMGDSTTATVAGAVLGGAAGTYAQSKIAKKDAQRVTVNMIPEGASRLRSRRMAACGKACACALRAAARTPAWYRDKKKWCA